nr:MAG TPA: hypothetical protein [Caudoviricetes sp.]
MSVITVLFSGIENFFYSPLHCIVTSISFFLG